MSKSYVEQVTTYRAVSERLLAAIATQSVTHTAYETARDAHDDHRRTLVLDGVPGVPERCSSDLREAALHRALMPHMAALRAARDQLRASNTALESAQVQERVERETLRSFHAAAVAQ